MIPRATYRIQFHEGFTFADGAALAPYMARLGISHLYASPIATAQPGSTHGYDAVDPATIAPVLGGEDGFRAMAAELRAHGLGIVLDIVPNHVGVGGRDNRWWLDVLAKGRASPYARFFDVDWGAQGKLLAPFLGAPYPEVLGTDALQLVDDADGVALIAYDTHLFPIRAEDHAEVRTAGLAAYRDAARLHDLLERQHWRLAWWRTAGDAINWRRFFDITELAALRIEDEAVFDAVHALPLRLYAEGLIDGVRVDHVDGLADPGGYCRRLRAALDAIRPGGWLVVEKILGPGETLPASWRTDGTSGYDFMDEVSALQHDPAGQPALDRLWTEISARPADFSEEEHAARAEILDRSFAGQLDAAVAAFERLARLSPEHRDLTGGMIRRALRLLLVHFPAYRSYGTGEGGEPQPQLDEAVRRARPHAAPGEAAVLDHIAGWIGGTSDEDRHERAEAARRFEQLSAPLSAKAVEDTAFYRYGRLLSRTDVGFDPATFALPPAAFATAMAERVADMPHAMLTTATHDHKRGEDVRARLAVLSEIAPEWAARVRGWLPLVDEIDPADAYVILQTLVGAWPLSAQADFAERVRGWSTKALREAKLRSSWVAPDEAYEAACAAAIARLIDAHGDTLAAFVDRIAAAGAVNGIAQAVLRATLPGVPDCYQGADYWDLSLVDPDNRRPVDFAARAATLGTPPDPSDWRSGAIKQAALAEALALRAQAPDLFRDGSFTRLPATGTRARHVFAFTRDHGGRRLTVAVPLHVAEPLAGGDTLAIPAEWWGDTALAGRPVAALFARAPWHMEIA